MKKSKEGGFVWLNLDYYIDDRPVKLRGKKWIRV